MGIGNDISRVPLRYALGPQGEPQGPAEPPAGPRGSRKIKFPISCTDGLVCPGRSALYRLPRG